jgi:hypothetical protein
MCSTYEEMERRLPHLQLLRLHAVHVRIQLRITCLLMHMQVGTAPHAC